MAPLSPLSIIPLSGLAATLGSLAVIARKSARMELDRGIWRLQKPRGGLPGAGTGTAWPKVSVIVPARNEERNVRACLESAAALDYPDLEILLVDDGSTDRTRELAEAVAARAGSRVRVLDGARFESSGRSEWACQKSFVLWNAAQEARGEWILFLDCDTRQRPDGLWRTMTMASELGLEAFSASGIYRNPGFWGDLLEGLLYSATFVAMPLAAINDPARPVGWLNGQFILIRRDAYFRAGGHLAVKPHAFDDMSLGRLLKEKGVRYRFLPGAALYSCVNYVGLGEAMRGWKRLLTATGWLGFGRAFFWLTGFLMAWVCLMPWVLLAAGAAVGIDSLGALGGSLGALGLADPTILQLAGGQTALTVLVFAAMRVEMKTPAWRAIFLPVAACLAVAVFVGGYRLRFRAGAVEFRGRVMKTDGTL